VRYCFSSYLSKPTLRLFCFQQKGEPELSMQAWILRGTKHGQSVFPAGSAS
jgi:hypothetical protein